MNDMDLKLQRPIITGRPAAAPKPGGQSSAAAAGGKSFSDLLQQSMAARTQTATQPLTLSKHAVQRAQQRDISLNEEDFARLDRAVELAQDKGLTDTLVLMDDTAFIVNVPNRVVVTMVDHGAAEDTVFTNIDGAVLV